MIINIVTFSKSPSYGATLQCYALCKVLKLLGHTPLLVDVRLPKESGFKYRVRSLLSFSKFYKFRKKNFPKFVNYKSKSDLVIIGSDQVWNPDLTANKALFFWGDFISDNTKIISYASSFGCDNWKYNNLNDKIRSHYLNKFRAVSVREKTGIEICNNIFNVHAECVLDPTLLLNDYSEFVTNSKLKKEYISVFKLYKSFSTEWLSFLDEIHLNTGLLIEDISIHNNSKFYQVKSVEFWITTIANADFVITDSFHCMVMAIIFHKKFIVIPSVPGREGRMKNLLKMLNLEDRLIVNYQKNEISEIIDKLKKDINYNAVDAILNNNRLKSMKYLKRNLF